MISYFFADNGEVELKETEEEIKKVLSKLSTNAEKKSMLIMSIEITKKQILFKKVILQTMILMKNVFIKMFVL